MDKQLLQGLLASGLTIREIAERSGITATPVRYWIKKHGLKANGSSVGQRTWTDEDLEQAVASSCNKSEVLRKLGLKVRPGNYDTLNKYLKKLQMSTSHFIGKSHGRGGAKRRPLVEILTRDSSYNRCHLKVRLVQEGLLVNKCAECGLVPKWNNKNLVMVLDHINGVGDDNRLENLRLLCPNCNSQQPTFCRRTKGEVL